MNQLHETNETPKKYQQSFVHFVINDLSDRQSRDPRTTHTKSEIREEYLESSQTSTMEVFRENSSPILVVNCLRKKVQS